MKIELAILGVICAACTVSSSAGPFGDEGGGPPSGDSSSLNSTTTLESASGDSAAPENVDSSTGGAIVESTGRGTESDDSDSELKLDVAADDDTGGIDFGPAEVFGHSGTMLYRVDPETNLVEEVGPFIGCTASIIDIALNAQSQMYGTAFGSLWRIDRTTGQCTKLADGAYPTSLSFVPAGTVDPAQEALVGFVGAQYIRIDTNTGSTTPIGALTDGLASSGDMVSVNHGGTWLTVVGPGCNDGDCIVEIDPSTGMVLHNYGPLPYDEVYGLAFWAGRAYGFARPGQLFQIELANNGLWTAVIPIPEAPANLEFFGAGSTTAAPPVG